METNIVHIQSCPICSSKKGIARLVEDHEAEVRGEIIHVERVIRQCGACGVKFSHSRDPDWYVAVYALYRERVGMVSIEEMLGWRERKSLSQDEAAARLRWDPMTYARFERGSLMTPEQDIHLREVMRA